jgi:hypothetical protein
MLRAIKAGVRVLPLAGVAALFSGCATAVGLSYICEGPNRRMVDMKAIQSGDKLYFEVREEEVDKSKVKRQLYTSWARLDPKKLFEKADNITWNFSYSDGAIPSEISSTSNPQENCLTTEMKGSRLGIHDSCEGRNRETLITYNWTKKYGHPWRLAISPVVVPVALAVDIVLLPIYLAYGVKCATKGCPK